MQQPILVVEAVEVDIHQVLELAVQVDQASS